MKIPHIFLLLLTAGIAYAGTVADSQKRYFPKNGLKNQVPPAKALINTDAEPDLTHPDFVSLYNGKNLDGWIPRGGTCTFEAAGDKIIGKNVPGSPNTFLSTVREDYGDFIFTVEVYWAVNSNSGVMIRAKRKPGNQHEIVYGPQVELEGAGARAWSGGIYGERIGGWHYPMWLEAHQEAREALNMEGWNRVTIQAIGNNVKTWINGVPAANWENDEYREGFIGLQIHAGKKGELHFRNIKIREPN
ncbi:MULTISPECIES: DUF1080 domain-containing protein [unclassified Lentimonas]|uniref:3-keto-disaccharide hydrolase n=1 Tax=unclassified Lentimonas TaxID=2630993 RepID=UPI001321E54E|nr:MULTISPECIES: DUF1080 domain-containing protein [unclassified Lentimonas]CAA6680187.1 Probable secreted glycosyl hydrolase [Lentimonas sp. CC4]CAA6687059.1 Probable secreted glycosyl hydrolase [Lentimonas sp. CC6]CAA7076167.1 Probable secreted glycosyl hydrolase [Lentimonas sp. CC4]CAA7171184.1 Probable secreted glycosyl hydrolase [Lentimonas sp. CC21]CAA7182765.1 Probable secreted glycosyl hydrolase [Lentimonas sp. CC8]